MSWAPAIGIASHPAQATTKHSTTTFTFRMLRLLYDAAPGPDPTHTPATSGPNSDT
jgi:hypothetical protein